ncbi:MAG: DUF456 domain-containing protein [Bacteroidaceae bacterium]|nr:DUF456 domain-containing protein [Bacteroidaceae bacterium]
MDIFLLVLAVLLVLVGLVGAIAPGLPGPPLSFVGLVLAHLSDRIHYSVTTLVVMGILMVVITILDYIVPSIGTKRMGGSKQGVRGSNIGLVVGLILSFVFPPLGIPLLLVAPFIGAYIGETIAGSEEHRAMRAALGTFIGFLAGTAVKTIYGIILLLMVVIDLIRSFV